MAIPTSVAPSPALTVLNRYGDVLRSMAKVEPTAPDALTLTFRNDFWAANGSALLRDTVSGVTLLVKSAGDNGPTLSPDIESLGQLVQEMPSVDRIIAMTGTAPAYHSSLEIGIFNDAHAADLIRDVVRQSVPGIAESVVVKNSALLQLPPQQ